MEKLKKEVEEIIRPALIKEIEGKVKSKDEKPKKEKKKEKK